MTALAHAAALPALHLGAAGQARVILSVTAGTATGIWTWYRLDKIIPRNWPRRKAR